MDVKTNIRKKDETVKVGNFDEVSTASPWWISGMTDAEGNFSINFNKNSNKVTAAFKITQKVHSIKALIEIRNYFNCGNIIIDNRKEQGYKFQVSSLKDISNIIIPHFENYPLNSSKHLDYISFKSAILLFNESRTDNLDKILDIKNEMNRSRSLNSRLNYMENKTIKLDKAWVQGFIDGEGCFYFYIGDKDKLKLLPSLEISQKGHDKALLEAISNLFEAGYIKPKINDITKVSRLIIRDSDKVIEFIDNNPLLTTKQMDYMDWKLLVKLKKEKAYNTQSGLSYMYDINNRRNSKRTDFLYLPLIQKRGIKSLSRFIKRHDKESTEDFGVLVIIIAVASVAYIFILSDEDNDIAISDGIDMFDEDTKCFSKKDETFLEKPLDNVEGSTNQEIPKNLNADYSSEIFESESVEDLNDKREGLIDYLYRIMFGSKTINEDKPYDSLVDYVFSVKPEEVDLDLLNYLLTKLPDKFKSGDVSSSIENFEGNNSNYSTASAVEFEKLVRAIRSRESVTVTDGSSSLECKWLDSPSESLKDLDSPSSHNKEPDLSKYDNLEDNEKKNNEHTDTIDKPRKIFVTKRVEIGEDIPSLPSWTNIRPRPTDPSEMREWELESQSLRKWTSKYPLVPEHHEQIKNSTEEDTRIAKELQKVDNSYDDKYDGLSDLFKQNDVNEPDIKDFEEENKKEK